MSFNHYQLQNLKRRLVQRSNAPRYKGKFALSTDVNLLKLYESFTETMQRAAKSMGDAWYIHFKVETDQPADTIRIVPSILQSFNRTRTLRRARVSGLRMCNLFTDSGDWYYVSDMVVSCAFDALAISTALADYAHIGSFINVQFAIPPKFRNRGKDGIRNLIESIEYRFWGKSHLARHSVFVSVDDRYTPSDRLIVTFEPKTISPVSLLHYILGSLGNSLQCVEIGRNNRLMLTRNPLWCPDDYLVYHPDKALNNYRYKHFAAFGTFYNNPDYPIY